MVNKTEEQKVIINEQELPYSELDDRQRYYHAQILDLRKKHSQISFELDQVNASLGVFEKLLIDSTQAKAEEVLAEEKEKA